MKAKISPTSPKHTVADEKAVDQFLASQDTFVRPTKPRSIFTIIFFGILGGLVAGVLGAVLLTNLALNTPTASLWSWLGITFPENANERVIIREQNNTGDAQSDILKKVGPAVIAFSSQPGMILDRDLTGNGLILSSDGVVISVDGISHDGSTHAILADERTVETTGAVTEDPASPLVLFRLDTTSLPVTTLAAPDGAAVGDTVMVVRRTAQGTLAYAASPIMQYDALPHADGADFYLSSELFARHHIIQPLSDAFRGAPVFTMDGEALGVLRDPAAGVVVPLDTVRPVLNRLLTNGAFERTAFGVRYQDISAMPAPEQTNEKATTSGAVLRGDTDRGIVAVATGSPAEDAGLASGDIIIAVNETQLSNPEALTSVMQSFGVGEKVQVTFVRDGAEQRVSVTLGSQ